MLSEALDWSTIDPKNDKKNIMECKPLLLDPYMTYEDEDYRNRRKAPGFIYGDIRR